jgi:hypothetical protein
MGVRRRLCCRRAAAERCRWLVVDHDHLYDT